MKRTLLLLVALMAGWQLLFGQATINCYPGSDDYHTGSTNGSSFTQTSLIKTQSGGVEAGWARFDISGIPLGSTVQSVELNIYIAQDNNAYWYVMSMEDDPLLGTASSVYSDCTDGDIYSLWQGDFPQPGWYVTDLGSQAVADVQAQIGDGWFGIAMWEFELGGSWAITCDGWNQPNPPYLVITYLVPGAPLPAHNPYPPHNSLGVDVNVDLSWDFGDATETYDLYFDTQFPPVDMVVSNAPSGATGTYDPGVMEFTTTYYWQVVSKNSAAELETPGPIWKFTTACDAWEVPIFEDFSAVTIPNVPYCWTGVVNSFSTWAQVATINYNGLNGGNCVTLYNSDDPAAELLLISPMIEGGASGKYVSFFGWGYANVSVGTITDPADPSTYNEISVVTLSNLYLDYQEFEVFFTGYSGNDEYIAFKSLNNSWYQDIYLDNILIDFAPTCPKPNELTAAGPTTNSVILDWTENGTAETWEIEYGYAGFTPTGIPMVSVTSHPYTLGGLESGTEYDWYVRAFCDDDDQSYWSTKGTFATQCEAFDVPVFEFFDNTAIPEIPLCWSELVESTSPWAYIETVSWNSYSPPNSIVIYNSDDPTAEVILVSPMLTDPINELWINFFAFGYAPELIIGTLSDPTDASTFTEVGTVMLDYDWQEYEVFFGSYSGTDQYIGLKGGFSGWYQDIYVDNITIDHPPTCPKPSGLTASNPTTTSVWLEWTENGTATTWQIEYGYAGFTPTGVPTVTVTEDPYQLGGLESGTKYDWYVRAYCSEDDQSYWSPKASFTTLCEPFEVPVFEDFDDAFLPEVPVCWTPLLETTSQWATIETIGWNAYSWPNSLYMYNSDDPDAEVILVSPMMVDPVNELWINFYAFGYAPELIIGTISDPFDASTFTAYETVSLSTSWQEFDAFFGNYTGTDAFIALKGGFGAWYQEMYIDNIIIDHLPTCPKPTGLSSSAPTTTSIVLNWTENGGATTWQIEYGYEGFTPQGIPTITVYQDPYTLEGLESGTSYDWYVRAYCSETDQSYWSSKGSFTTLCEPFEVPVFEFFDNASVPEVPVCWSPLVETTSMWAGIETVTWNSYSAPNSLYMYNSDDPSAEMILVSPMLTDPANELWINFFAFGYAPQLVIGTLSDPLDASTFTPVSTVTIGTTWQEYEVFFSSYTGTDQFLGIKGGFSGWYQEIYIDNITIDHPPTCPKPANLYATQASQTSIMLGWTENGSADQWNIEYGFAGFSPTGVGNAVASANPFLLTGLEDGTHYEFYVQSDCGGGDLSYWVGPHHFQTLCYPIVLAAGDYSEDFEGMTPPLVPPCITVENSNFDNVAWQTSFENPNSGISHMRITYGGNLMDDWFFSAPLELLGGQTYNVVFYYASNSEWYAEKLEVFWGDAPESDAMIGDPIFDDNSITTNGVYVEGTASFTPPENGVYFVGWHGYSEPWQWDLYVDDIFIEWDNSLVVTASADPSEICQGGESQLSGGAVGGSGNYTYSWTSDPPGFTSNQPNPVVSPSVTTDYILEVNDTFVSIYDTVTVFVTQLPGVPGTPTGITFFCASWGTATYSSTGASGANWYDWVLSPEDAGTMTGTGTSVSIDWTEGWLGLAQLKVIGMHDECAGPESGALNINVYLPNVTLDVVDSVGLNWQPFELTGGSPSGGVYSGPGVDDDGWFDPMVAGIGEHTITYTYTDLAACENSAEDVIVVVQFVDVSEYRNDIMVTVNPNPSQGVFTLTLKSPQPEQFTIRITNSFGEEVHRREGVHLDGSYTERIDLSAFSEGLYYLHIYSDQVSHVEKIILK